MIGSSCHHSERQAQCNVSAAWLALLHPLHSPLQSVSLHMLFSSASIPKGTFMVRRALLACSLVLALSSLAQGTKPIPLYVGVEGANPKLAITSFSGPQEIRSSLDSVFKRCGWFELTSDTGKAEYQVSAQYLAGPPAQLQIRLLSRKGPGFTLTQPAVANEPADQVVYRAVDTIINKLFRVPGPCAAPIAFAMGAPGNLKEVFTCRFDGTNLKRLTHNNSISTEPSWGPNNTTLVYTTYAANTTSVILMDMTGHRQRRLSRFPGLNASADLSPDGRLAVLSLSRDQRIDLYLLDVASGKLQRLTQDSSVESSPCWSPDGREICYVSDARGKPQLFRISASGGSPSPVMRSREETVSPDWSPASNRVCFSRRMGNQYAIGMVDMATGKTEILTRAAGDWESPSWAPDGRQIICSRRVGAVRALYIVDSLLKTATPVTQGPDHSLPNWGNP